MLEDCFSALLRTSVGTSKNLLEDRAEAEVGKGIFEVGIEPLDRSHVRVRNIFHREGNPFLPLTKWRHRMPELIPVEDHEIAWVRNQLQMLGRFDRIVLKELTDQLALRRSIDESHQNGIAGPFVIGGVIVKPDVVPRLGVVIERAGMGVVFGAQTELGLDQAAQQPDEGLGSIEIEKTRGLLHHRVVTHAPALFVAWYIVAIQIALHTLRLRDEMFFHHRPGKELRNKQELVLVPILTGKPIEIQPIDRLIDRFS